MEKDEELLIRKAQRGNLLAFEQLVHRYDAKIMRLIFNMVNDVEDARDLYQEVFIKLFKSLHRFRFESEFYTYLCRIAINACINHRKRRTIQQHESLSSYVATDDENWQRIAVTESKNPEQQLIDKELNEQIHRSLENLSSKQRTVFVLKHYHGYKLREIAEILDCSEGTVKSYLFRAVQKLKKSLASYHHI